MLRSSLLAAKEVMAAFAVAATPLALVAAVPALLQTASSNLAARLGISYAAARAAVIAMIAGAWWVALVFGAVIVAQVVHMWIAGDSFAGIVAW